MTEKPTMFLPEGLVVEILSKSPLSSLARLRSTCRSWNSLIKDTITNKSHQPMMLIDSSLYLVNLDFHGSQNDIVKVTDRFTLKDPLSNAAIAIRHVFHCDGFLLCSTYDDRLVVRNPILGETKWIQPKIAYSTRLDYYAFGKSSCNEYKILRMDQTGHLSPSLVRYEIYRFSSGSWMLGGMTNEWYIPRIRSRGTSFNGNTYWLAQARQATDFLLCFDFSADRFGSVSLPGDHSSYQVVALSVTRDEQRLCLLATRAIDSLDIDVWMATDIKINRLRNGVAASSSWVKMFTVQRDVYKSSFMFCNGMNFLVDQEDNVLVCPGKDNNSKCFLHIVGEDTHIRVDRHDAGSRCSVLLSYVPTMARIQQGGEG